MRSIGCLEFEMFNTNPFVNFATWFIFVGAFLFSLWVIKEACRKAVWKYRNVFIYNPRYRRGEQLIKKALDRGPLWVTNIENKVTSYCLFQDFFEALKKETGRMKTENNLTTRIRVSVFPTFSFAENMGNLVLAHAGTKWQGIHLLEKIAEDVLGVKKGEISDKHFKEAVSYLIHKDERLFVTFAGDSSRSAPCIEATTYEEAKRYLALAR